MPYFLLKLKHQWRTIIIIVFWTLIVGFAGKNGILSAKALVYLLAVLNFLKLIALFYLINKGSTGSISVHEYTIISFSKNLPEVFITIVIRAPHLQSFPNSWTEKYPAKLAILSLDLLMSLMLPSFKTTLTLLSITFHSPKWNFDSRLFRGIMVCKLIASTNGNTFFSWKLGFWI